MLENFGENPEVEAVKPKLAEAREENFESVSEELAAMRNTPEDFDNVMSTYDREHDTNYLEQLRELAGEETEAEVELEDWLEQMA